MSTTKSTRVLALLSCAMLAVLAGCGSSSSGGGGGGGGGGSPSSSNSPPSLSSLRGQTITVTSWGGVWTQDEQKYLYGPFTKDTGIKVKVVVNGSDPAVPSILQEQQHNVSIDISESLNPIVLLQKQYVQTFPSWLTSEFQQDFRPGSYTNDTVDIGDTATVIACNPGVMKKCPTNPQQFFDVKDYPGPRAIVDDPDEAMPMALEATGVAPSKLFPLNVSAAMKELKAVKSSISVWPSSGSQQQQVLIDKQVGAEIMWNGRAYVVSQSIPNLQISWDGSLLPEPNGFVVLKDAPHAAAAFEYFSWLAQHPKNQAEWSSALTYPMPAKGLNSYLSPKVAAALPVGKKVTISSNTWFAKNESTVEHAWQGFLG